MPGEIWLDLLNSDWHDHLGSGRGEDRLENPTWLRGYLDLHGIDTAGIPRDRLVASLRDSRTILRRIADAYARRAKVPASDWNALNLYFGRAPLIRKVEIADMGRAGTPRDVQSSPRPRLKLVPLSGRLESSLSEISSAFVETLEGGDPARVKICRNADCRWVFYDRSKNKSRKWCEDTCGNLMKVRRFRKRHRKS
ncbi:MAG: CGNR zinc finger domain-containing protein [Candidatus Aminicenantales bacterium]